ncbi:uncharacterized protein LOC119568845 [Penaeus monodon]|uniref:uncharacterized protein LOC119568845 n=1 Tax=Penaeus monodon TaxID=6687 RepID=UPI0018A7335E|nr:uncharacterized protein LOC119568845 [Penaeus monodon]
MEQARIYTRDPFVITSMKPRRLPHFLALVTPFTGTVWLILAISIFLTGVSLFVLLRAWSHLSGKPVFSLSTTLFFTWERCWKTAHRPAPELNWQGMNWWLVICLAILSVVAGSGYRSSLVAHLTVQLREAEVNTFHDLTERKGWRWGQRSFSWGLRGRTSSSARTLFIQEVFRGWRY